MNNWLDYWLDMKEHTSFSLQSQYFLLLSNQINICLYIRLFFKSGLSIYTHETTLILIHWKNLQTISALSNYLRLVQIDTNMITYLLLIIFMLSYNGIYMSKSTLINDISNITMKKSQKFIIQRCYSIFLV